jgi:hypothetical protein
MAQFSRAALLARPGSAAGRPLVITTGNSYSHCSQIAAVKWHISAYLSNVCLHIEIRNM